MSEAKTYRLTLEDGSTAEAFVTTIEPGYCTARGEGWFGDVAADTARGAAVRVASHGDAHGTLALPVIEILAPGEVTRAELLATITGRTVAPTDAEIIAHHAVGGSWLVGGRVFHSMREARRARAVCEARARSHAAEAPMWPPYVWIAIDEHGRPCAWPVASEAPRG